MKTDTIESLQDENRRLKAELDKANIKICRLLALLDKLCPNTQITKGGGGVNKCQ